MYLHVPVVNLDQAKLKSTEIREAEGCTCHGEPFKTIADRGRILKTRGVDAVSKVFKESRSFTHLLKNIDITRMERIVF